MSNAVTRAGIASQIKTDPGEIVRWSGAPVAGAFAFSKGKQSFLFGIPFTAFAVFWIYGASRAPAISTVFGVPISFALFGIPFIAAGIGMLCSPIYFFIRAKNTTYALTDKRAIIDTRFPFEKRRSFSFSAIEEVELSSAIGGGGHVYFARDPSGFRFHGGHSPTAKDGFVAVRDAEKVEQQLRQLMDRFNRSKT